MCAGYTHKKRVRVTRVNQVAFELYRSFSVPNCFYYIPKCFKPGCSYLVWLLKTKNGQYLEKNGTKINLVPLDAEFSAEQHIQNPLKSILGKNNYYSFNFKNLEIAIYVGQMS